MEARKVSGILTEAAVGVEEQRLRYAVVGIGINVAPPDGGFPEGLEHIATSIYTEPLQSEVRNRLAAEVLQRFRSYAEDLPGRAYFDSYRARLFVLGRDVTLERGKEREKVHVRGLDNSGALIVETADGRVKTVASGEVSLRF